MSSAVLFASIPATMALHGPLHLWLFGVYVCALLLIRLGEVFVLALPRAVRSRHKLPTRMRGGQNPPRTAVIAGPPRSGIELLGRIRSGNVVIGVKVTPPPPNTPQEN